MSTVLAPPAAEIEAVEAEAWVELQLSLPEEFRRSFGIRVDRMAGGVLLLAQKSLALAMNRAMSLGLDRPMTEAELDAIIAHYAAAGVDRFVLHWLPEGRPSAMSNWLDERGFTFHSHWAKLFRRTSVAVPHTPLDPGLHVEEIGPRDADAFQQVVADALRVPSGLELGTRSTIGRPGWRYYMVFDGDRPIAGAASFLRGRHAWLGLGGTADGDRRRGAQSALLSRRIADAAAAGCEWVSADTAPDKPDKPNQSYHNMLRLGFDLLYERPNYLLDIAGDGGSRSARA